MDSVIEAFVTRGDLADIALLLWAAASSGAVVMLLKELSRANRRFDDFVRELARFNSRFDDRN
jgi:hypothetical protein